MTQLGYSGGRGRGRGRGRHTSRGRGRGRGSHPGRGHGSTSSTSSKSWTRPKSAKTKVEPSLLDKNEMTSTKFTSIYSEIAATKEAQPVVPEVQASSTTNLHRRGRNKLVLNSNDSNNEKQSDSSASERPSPRKKLPPKPLLGNHKLIIHQPDSIKKTAGTERSKSTSPEQEPTDTQAPRKNLKRVGQHKLVVQQTKPHVSTTRKYLATTTRPSHHRMAKRIKLATTDQHQSHTSRESSKPPASETKSGPQSATSTAAVVLTETDEIDNAEGATTTTTEDQRKNNKELTDFAYRSTSRVLPIREHNRKWKMDSSSCTKAFSVLPKGPRTMGLVRVPPPNGAAEKTPICPFFLRGINCIDPYCRKRHDIPKQYTMPVCSFFQRHGQCTKGDECPFRHVKVNTMADVCPSFSILGYCEDDACTMKHERERPKAESKKSNRVYARPK